MRPNLANAGDTPAVGVLSSCPDIWISGDSALPDYKTSLITGNSYAIESNDTLIANKDNYIYVRGKNGGDIEASQIVTLYYADGAVIQWPSQWLNNVIGTDLGPNTDGRISNIPSGEIGVVDRPFVWRDVQPYTGTCHYCLVAQFNDEQNSNPKPKVSGSIDMAKLVANNLQWGWRNISAPKKDDTCWSYRTKLSVDINIEDGMKTYLLLLKPVNIPEGYYVSFECSQPDSEGNKIELQRTEVKGSSIICGQQCQLAPGFNGMISVYLYGSGEGLENVSLEFEADCYATLEELEQNDALHLHDPNYTNAIHNHLGINNIGENATIIRLGGYTASFNMKQQD
ncbi:MAG: hypothetical protein SNG90_08935 [Rikenellaceae bacterium]